MKYTEGSILDFTPAEPGWVVKACFRPNRRRDMEFTTLHKVVGWGTVVKWVTGGETYTTEVQAMISNEAGGVQAIAEYYSERSDNMEFESARVLRQEDLDPDDTYPILREGLDD